MWLISRSNGWSSWKLVSTCSFVAHWKCQYLVPWGQLNLSLYFTLSVLLSLCTKDDHYPKKDWPSFIMRSAERFYLMVNQILINAEDRIGYKRSMERLSFQETAFLSFTFNLWSWYLVKSLYKPQEKIVWWEISHINVFGEMSRSKVKGMKINEKFFNFLRRKLRV